MHTRINKGMTLNFTAGEGGLRDKQNLKDVLHFELDLNFPSLT